MALESYAGTDGMYAVDWELLMRCCRSYVRAKSTFNNAQLVPIEEPLIGPTIFAVNVNWDRVTFDVSRESIGVFNALRTSAETSMSHGATLMRVMINETNDFKDRFSKMQLEATRTSMENMNRSVDRLGTTVSALRIVRDYSAEFVLITAGCVSGGAALGALGVGSALKGTAKWEDSGNFAAGVATASTELLFGAIPIKLRLSGVSAMNRQIAGLVLGFARMPSELYKSAVEGKPLITGAVAGGLKFNDPAAFELYKQFLVEGTPEKFKMAAVAVGAVARLARNTGIKFVQDSATAPAAPRTNAAAPRATLGSGTTTQAMLGLGPRIQPSVVDLVTFDPNCIGEFAICKM